MSRHIHIENLQIRLSKISADKARNIGHGLGDEILRQIAESTRQKNGKRQIENLDAGKISAGKGKTTAETQRLIARKIADLIGERIK